jgi:DNA-binding CsgD family transcriptional regulator
MPDLTSLMRSSVLSYGHLSVITDMKGEERAVYLGYSLPLSKAELLLLKTILLSLPVCLSTNEIAEATGISAGQISVLVNRINRKASAIGNRKLILGTSHHGFQLNEFM